MFMSYKGFIDDYPKEIVDKIYLKADATHRDVYRALFKTADCLSDEDFVPYFIDRKPFVPKCLLDCGDFGMSVFEDLNQLKKTMKSSKSQLYDQIKGYAFGHTNFSKGRWGSPNKNTHIEYYLFDWINNNPSCDFELFEKV